MEPYLYIPLHLFTATYTDMRIYPAFLVILFVTRNIVGDGNDKEAKQT
jgi:hypothetical protein